MTPPTRLHAPAPPGLLLHDAVPPGVARWRLRLLGDLVLDDGHQRINRLPSRAVTALLARLAMAPQRAHPREELIELLWPGVDLPVGRNRLRQVLSTLKSLLEPAGSASPPLLLADRQALRLAPGALACDVPAFEAALQQGRLAEAQALYQGELLPGLYDDWISHERLRLAALAEGLVAVVAPPPLQPALPPLPAPSRHALPRYLTALQGVDEVGARLRAEVLAHRLVTVLGPGGHGKTRLAVEVAHTLADAAGWRDAGLAPPAFDLVAFVPLVACADARACHDALWMALHQGAGPAPVQPAPPAATNPAAEPGAGAQPLSRALVDLLAGRQALLLLDNVEQLVPPALPLLADLLALCPGLHLLVTSRRALGLDGEREFLLPPLPLPAAAADVDSPDAVALNPAVALFVDRARAVRADFHLSSRNRQAVVALVRHLEGMPLAIELAAARVRSLAPAALLALLQAAGPGSASAAPSAAHASTDPLTTLPPSPDDPLALLARSGPRAGQDARHASMLAVVQWSWRLLAPPAQRLLARLSVFAGGCSLQAAQAVCAEPGQAIALLLDELVSQSLVRVDGADQRWQSYELIRSFAGQRLTVDEAAQLRQRHRAWLIGWFAALPMSAPLQQVRQELPNVATALASAAADNRPEDAAALAQAGQWALSAVTLPPQALQALRGCADRLTDPVQRAVTRANLSRTLLLAGQTAAAEQLAAQAEAELPASGLARATVLTRLAHLRWRLHRDPAAQAWLDEALQLARAANDAALQASILTNLGALLRPSQPGASITLQRQAIAQWQQAGDGHGISVGRCNLALALSAAGPGHREEALLLLDQALHDTAQAGDEFQHALAANLRGEVLCAQRRWPAAVAAYQRCISTAFAVAEPWPMAYGLWNLPRTLAHAGQPRLAAQLMGFAEHYTPTITGPLGRADRIDLRRVRRLCRAQLPADQVDALWQQGAALVLAAVVRLAVQPEA